MNKYLSLFINKEFYLFLFVGVINTFNGVIFSYLYSSYFDANISFILGYITSLVVSYLLNSFITFKEQLSIIKLIKFAISYIPNFIIQNIVVLVVYNWLNYDKLIAYIIAAVIGVPVTFVFMKLFAFKDGKKGKDI